MSELVKLTMALIVKGMDKELLTEENFRELMSDVENSIENVRDALISADMDKAALITAFEMPGKMLAKHNRATINGFLETMLSDFQPDSVKQELEKRKLLAKQLEANRKERVLSEKINPYQLITDENSAFIDAFAAGTKSKDGLSFCKFQSFVGRVHDNIKLASDNLDVARNLCRVDSYAGVPIGKDANGVKYTQIGKEETREWLTKTFDLIIEKGYDLDLMEPTTTEQSVLTSLNAYGTSREIKAKGSGRTRVKEPEIDYSEATGVSNEQFQALSKAQLDAGRKGVKFDILAYAKEHNLPMK